MKKIWILCSAIHINDGKDYTHTHQPKNIKKGFVVAGRRHCDIYSTLFITGYSNFKNNSNVKTIQGFLSSDNMFLDRKEAFLVAKEADQIVREVTNGKLYSENIFKG